MPRRTALIVPVPEAEPLIGELRLAHDPSAALGVPAHITILFPFAPLERLDLQALRDLLERFPAFDFTLDRVERFEEGVVWLHPQPSEPFVDLTAALMERWPDYPPYEGIYDEPIPHLTVSVTPIELDLPLPLACRARAVLLLEERESDGRWESRLAVPLATAQGVA